MKVALAGIAAAAVVATGAAHASSHPCLVVTSAGDRPFARNFNPFVQPLDFTLGGIYEPLVVVTPGVHGREHDWLAERLRLSSDRTTLTLTVRRGVRWSDGMPLTNRDVAYTLTAGRQAKIMDQIGLTRPGNEVVSVQTRGPRDVVIRLRRPDSSFVSSVLANNVVVIPRHAFAHVKNVGGWSNPDPVGSGPFDVVRRFGDQSYVLDRNPRYWRAGAPRVACVERVLASSTESAVLQLIRGDVDLTNDLIPNVQKAYVSHDPAHFHYWYPADALPIGLFVDDTRYPYSLPVLRKAMSLAIDRIGLSRFAEYGYAPPVDALGIDRIWPSWTGAGVAAEARRLAEHDPAQARRMLRNAGFVYSSGALLDPRGRPVTLTGTVVASWPDWYTDWQVIARDLREIGIAVTIDAVPDFDAWLRKASATTEATLLWNTAADNASPYKYFAEHLDPASFVPSRKSAESTGNWEHFKSPAAAGRLLARFRETSDVAAQRRLAEQLERIWLRMLPFIPLFAGPTWSTYSTRYFTGYPTAANDYVAPDFRSAEYVLALTLIRPVR